MEWYWIALFIIVVVSIYSLIIYVLYTSYIETAKKNDAQWQRISNAVKYYEEMKQEVSNE